MQTPGCLYIVATPIGNMGDVSARCGEVLSSVDVVAAEDTRRSSRLLKQLSIRRRLVSYREQNETEVSDRLLAELKDGRSVALISDAGTPLVSDPGFTLVSKAVGAGVQVLTVPGPSAVTAALSVAGLPTDRFVFEGFLPARANARRSRLTALADEPRTLVFFEAPHRMARTLADMVKAFGDDREAALARELTKLHEQTYKGRLADLQAGIDREEIPARGEFVVIVAGAPQRVQEGSSEEARRILALLKRELPTGKAVKLAQEITGLKRRELYRMAVALGSQEAPP